MATNNIDILISAKDQATTTLKKVDKEVSGLNASVTSLAPSWTKIGAIAAAALAGIGYGAIKAIQSYNEVEAINMKLEHAVIAVSHGTREQKQAMSDLADEMERKGVIDADGLRLGQAQLSTFGLQSETVKVLTQSLADLTVNQFWVNAASADYEASANMIAKALNGQFWILEKSGIRFSEAQKAIIAHGTESQKAAAIQEGFAQNLKYTNDIAAKTAEWGLARMHVALGNIMERIGLFLQPIVIAFTNNMANMAQSIGAWFEKNKSTIEKALSDISWFIWTAWTSIKQFWSDLWWMWSKVLESVTWKTWDEMWKTWRIFSYVGMIISNLIIIVSYTLSAVLKIIVWGFKIAVSLMKGLWNGTAGLITTAMFSIADMVMRMINWVIDGINLLSGVLGIDAIKPFRTFTKEAMGAAKYTVDAFSWMGSDIATTFTDTMKGVNDSSMTMINWLLKNIDQFNSRAQVSKPKEDWPGGNGTNPFWETNSATKWSSDAMKELQKNAEEAMSKIIDKSKDGKKAIDDVKEAIKKKTEEWKKYKDEWVKALQAVMVEIKKVADEAWKITFDFWVSKDQKLWERMVQVQQDILSTQKDINNESDPEKQAELQTKLNALLSERAYIQANASQQAIIEAQSYANLSDAQRIVVDLEKEKGKALEENKAKMDALMEKKMVLEAQANQKSVNDQKIFLETKDGITSASILNEAGQKVALHDQEAINLAVEVANKQSALKQESLDLASQLADKLTQQSNNLKLTQDAYLKFNKFIKDDTKATADAMIWTLAGVNAQLERTIALRARAGMNTTPVDWTRALGGPVSSGSTYLVGERWPELFTPSSSWNITPNNQLGGVTVSINFGGVSVRNESDINSIANMVADTLTRKLQLSKMWIAS